MAIQYRLELAIAGKEDGAKGGLNTSQRFESLRIHEAAWSDFRATSVTSYLNLDSTPLLPPGETGIWVHTRNGRALELHQIPSAIRGIPAFIRAWSYKTPGIEITYNLDIAQDLLVINVQPSDRYVGYFQASISSFNVYQGQVAVWVY